MTSMATIAADIDGRRVLCRISSADLRKKYRESIDEPMQLVREYRSELETAAKALIENESFEQDGSIVIKYRDL